MYNKIYHICFLKYLFCDRTYFINIKIADMNNKEMVWLTTLTVVLCVIFVIWIIYICVKCHKVNYIMDTVPFNSN